MTEIIKNHITSTEKILRRHFVDAWNKGQICLHPTDTLPGLSFNPRIPKSCEDLIHFKKRPLVKPWVSLIASVELAKKYWKPLPGEWSRFLDCLWPGPLTVVWQASSRAPSFLLCQKKETLALRCPKFAVEDLWMQEVLELVALPFPSTSVNESGKASAFSWQKALEQISGVSRDLVFIPKILPQSSRSSKQDIKPSTLIKLHQDGGYEILRAGMVSKKEIDQVISDTL